MEAGAAEAAVSAASGGSAAVAAVAASKLTSASVAADTSVRDMNRRSMKVFIGLTSPAIVRLKDERAVHGSAQPE